MYVTNYTQATVFAPDGTQVFPTVEDFNGNYFSKDGNGNVIDTLGRTPVSVTTNCNGDPTKTCYAILNSQGTTSTTVTVTTTSISVNTAFGQSGVTEYSGTLSTIQRIDLPDGTNYQFSYDSGTSSGHYGLLTSVTLPATGQITYGYTNFQDSFGNTNRWINSRTSGGGNWSYSPAVITTCPPGTIGCQQTVTLTKPSADNAVYTFTLNNGAWKSEVDSYTGAIASGSLVAIVADTWDFSQPCSPSPCAGASNIRVLRTTTTLPTPGGNNITSKTELSYADTNTSNVSAIKAWGFYAGSSPTFPATPDRETDFTYLSTTAYTNKNIINRVLSITVKDAGGNVVAKTNFAYDDTGTLLASTPSSGISQHDDSNFGISATVRGNLTKVQRCTVLPSCSSYLTTTMTYDTTGQALSVQDPKQNSTTFSYTDNFFKDTGTNPPQAFPPSAPTNAHLTSVTPPVIGAATFGYYYNTGKRAFSKDQNNGDTFSHFLDSMDRLTHFYGPPLNGNRPWTLTAYPPNSEIQVDTYVGIGDTSPSVLCSSCRHGRTLLDSWGRMTTQILVNDPEGTTTVATNYDTTGRVSSASHPYRTTGDSTYGFETPTYDGLNRVIKLTHQDNTYSQTFYGAAVGGSGLGGVTSQLCSSGTVGLGYPVLFFDEANKKRQSWTDGFGRTIEVDEPDPNGNLNSATCYVYDARGNLICAVQKGTDTSAFTSCASAPAAWRPRSYVYDALSRVTSLSIPEISNVQGQQCQVTYTYDNNSNLLTRTAPLPNQTACTATVTTTFSYDALNRLTQVQYNDGSTSTVTYTYDQGTNAWGQTQKGFPTGMTDGSGSTVWTFDMLGHALTEQRTIAGITKTISYSYNLDASVATVTYPSTKTVTYAVNNAQRFTSAKDLASNAQFAITASYAPPGGLQSVITGQINGGFGGVTESHTYNNRLEYSTTQATSSAGTALNLSMGYNLPGGNNGSVASITNNVDNGRTETITYDPLNRVLTAQSSASSGADCWGQNFGTDTKAGDDSLANLTAINSGPPPAQPCPLGYLSATANTNNHFTGTGYNYDAAGNTTQDGSGYTYTFDPENRITQASGMSGGPYCYVYDGNGLRVAKKSNATPNCSQGTITKLYWRSISGDTLAETDSSGSTTNSSYNEYVFFSGRRISSRNGTGSVYYYFADVLGSTRTITDAQGRICYDADFSPYGQEMSHTERLQSTACPPNYKFTGYERDTETGLDYAFARYYSSRLGRFLSADPLGGGVSNPQSMNRYAYVVNRPTVGTDPTGLVCDDDCIQNHEDAWAQRFISGTGGGCTVDGLDAPCSLAHGLLQMGAAVECHGYCSLFFVPTLAANGHWYILGATAEGVSWYNLLNGEPIENTPEVGLPEVDSEQAPGGPGRSGGGGGNTTQCTGKILNVLNQKIGTNFTTANVIGDFPRKGGFNIDVFATGLTAAQFNAIQPGSRWALSWKAAAFGYGPSLHIPKPMSFWDPFAYFHNENIGGRLSVQFTAHIDSAYPSNPIGAVLHFIIDVIGHSRRNACP